MIASPLSGEMPVAHDTVTVGLRFVAPGWADAVEVGRAVRDGVAEADADGRGVADAEGGRVGVADGAGETGTGDEGAGEDGAGEGGTADGEGAAPGAEQPLASARTSSAPVQIRRSTVTFAAFQISRVHGPQRGPRGQVLRHDPPRAATPTGCRTIEDERAAGKVECFPRGS